MNEKQEIKRRFFENVKEKEIKTTGNHCGKEGHWLEKAMQIKPNGKNAPDILGYEMKKDSSNKITLGDFSASEYLFSKKTPILNSLNGESIKMDRKTFIRTFGTPNPKKNGRFSWSGACVPSYGKFNDFGQKIVIDDEIRIIYNKDHDKRDAKPELKNGDITIAIWKEEKMKTHIERKFNQNGFFICRKKGNVYNSIAFGAPFTYETFINNIKTGLVFFDSGMYMSNQRNYSHWRAKKDFWNSLITEVFEDEDQDDTQNDMPPHSQSA